MAQINRAESFDRDFERFKREYDPRWERHLSDATYSELKKWYDAIHGLGSADMYSDEARDFADYVWSKIHDGYLPQMTVYKDGGDAYMLLYISRDDLRSLLTMIKGAGLIERRLFNKVKEQIEKLLWDDGGKDCQGKRRG